MLLTLEESLGEVLALTEGLVVRVTEFEAVSVPVELEDTPVIVAVGVCVLELEAT